MELSENKMASQPILSLLLSMALPAILSMIIQSMYNIVDSMFVARLGEEALTAVSLAFPIQNILLGVSVGTGIGVNSLIARTLGQKDYEKSNIVVSYGLILGILTWIIFVLLGLVLINPFFNMFTDSSIISNLGIQYTQLIVFFSFGIIIHIIIEKILQGSGNMIYPMVFVIVGAIINILLDPILIFGYLGMPALGVKGAAIATIIGQISAMCLAIITLIFRKNIVKIRVKHLPLDFSLVKDIYVVGIPATLMFILNSLVLMVLNGILIGISTIAVSVLGIFLKLQSFILMPVSGLTQGALPIMGFNYGADNRDRLLKTLKLSLIISVLIGGLGNILFLLFPTQLLRLFNSSGEMLMTGKIALISLSFSFVFMSINYVFSTLFQAVGKGTYSLVIALIRQVIILLPLSYLFAKVFGLVGVWATFTIAEVMANAVSLFLFKKLHLHKVSSNLIQSPCEKLK